MSIKSDPLRTKKISTQNDTLSENLRRRVLKHETKKALNRGRIIAERFS